MPVTPLMLEEANERLRRELEEKIEDHGEELPEPQPPEETPIMDFPKFEYRIDRLPSRKLERSATFLNVLGANRWQLVYRSGRDVIFMREKT